MIIDNSSLPVIKLQRGLLERENMNFMSKTTIIRT